MITTPVLILVLAFTTADYYGVPTGVIRGVVVNGSQGDKPLANAKVVLQAGTNGMLESVGETTTDREGKFRFEDVPIDPSVTFSAGAERDGIHYPAGRFQLNTTRTSADVRIRAFDSITTPSPLQALHHQIEMTVQNDVVIVKEALQIANRSNFTYVGETVGDAPLATLRLTIPPNFDRVTFGSEFFGRRFRVVEHQPVTDIPWPPGERELTFMYKIPLEESGGLLHRMLDLPTEDLTVRVLSAGGKKLHCNLVTAKQANDETVFIPQDKQLAAKFVIELQIGDPPIPWGKYARWGAVSTLALLIATTVGISQLRKRRALESRVTTTPARHLKVIRSVQETLPNAASNLSRHPSRRIR